MEKRYEQTFEFCVFIPLWWKGNYIHCFRNIFRNPSATTAPASATCISHITLPRASATLFSWFLLPRPQGHYVFQGFWLWLVGFISFHFGLLGLHLLSFLFFFCYVRLSWAWTLRGHRQGSGYIRIFKFIILSAVFYQHPLPQPSAKDTLPRSFRGLNPVHFLKNKKLRKLLHKNGKNNETLLITRKVAISKNLTNMFGFPQINSLDIQSYLLKSFTWNSKQPVFYGCFNWMIPNHYIKRGCFTKHPLKSGCLGCQVGMFLGSKYQALGGGRG